MYRYFFAFNFPQGSGNTILETSVKISEMETADKAIAWIRDVQEHIERVSNFSNVTITNFQLLQED